MSSDEELTPLEKLEAAYGGPGLPNLGLNALGTASTPELERDLFDGLLIINGITDEDLDFGDDFPGDKDDARAKAQGPQEAMARLLAFAFVGRATSGG